MNPFDASIFEKHEKVFTVNFNDFLDFEKVKVALLEIEGIEEITFDQKVSPAAITLFLTAEVTDKEVRQTVASLGFIATPKTFLIP